MPHIVFNKDVITHNAYGAKKVIDCFKKLTSLCY